MVTVDLFLQTRRRPPPPYEDFPAADFVWVGPKRRAGVLRKTAGSACGQVLPTCETHKLVHCCAKPVQRFVRYLRLPPPPPPPGGKSQPANTTKTRLEHQRTAAAPSPTERDPETVTGPGRTRAPPRGSVCDGCAEMIGETISE